MRSTGPAVIAAALLACSAPALAGSNGAFSMTVLVDGAPAPEYAARGHVYVEALRGRDFGVRLYNPGPGRAAVALSVDGRNVLDAKHTSAKDASKWILGPGQSLDVTGWQISGQTSRRFFFTETERSYAKWLGDTSNVGTIEAVFYRERYGPATGIARRDAPKDERELRVEEAQAPSVDGGAQGGVGGGTPADQSAAAEIVVAGEAPSEPSSKSARAPSTQPSTRPAPPARKESDTFAATGIGARTEFSVEWIAFDQEPQPAATLALRYEFREQLVRLGVLPRGDGLAARDHARGFAPEYAPDPDGRR